MLGDLEMKRFLATALALLLPSMTQAAPSTLVAGPVPYVNGVFDTYNDAVNKGLSNVNSYLLNGTIVANVTNAMFTSVGGSSTTLSSVMNFPVDSGSVIQPWIGYRAGYGSTPGGISALASSCFGDYTCGGAGAGMTGTGNTFTGYLDGSNDTNGGNNAGYGAYTFSSLTQGSGNTAYGALSATVGTTIAQNSYFGVLAGQQATGNNNAGFGASVFSAGSNSANNESCFGASSCTLKTAGSGDTIMGYQAGNATQATGSNNALYGAGTDTPTASTSNYVNIAKTYQGYSAAPTVTSGMGTGPTVTATGTAAFKIVTGTGAGSTTTVLALGQAPTGWICTAQDQTTAVTARQSANTTTSVTHTWSSAPTAGDTLLFLCGAF